MFHWFTSISHIRPLPLKTVPNSPQEVPLKIRVLWQGRVHSRGWKVWGSDVIFQKMADRYRPKPKFGKNFRPYIDRQHSKPKFDRNLTEFLFAIILPKKLNYLANF